jgi:hypothetical protein
MLASSRSVVETTSILYALEAMRQAKPLGTDHPLHQFLYLKPHHLMTLGGNVANEVRIFRGLAQHIRRRLRHHRKRNNISCASAKDRNNIIAALQDDFRVGNAELEAWSVLYHRFVEIDLDLSIKEISRAVQQTLRTLNRRQHLGVYRLTHGLIRRELRLRKKQRQAYLRSNLPSVVPPFIVGRDSALIEAVHYLSDSLPAHLILYGANGVGKTTLALALAHRLIEMIELEGVVWIDTPYPSYPAIMDEIAWQLSLPLDDIDISPSQYFQDRDTLIVLDHAQQVIDDPILLADLTAVLGSARLLLCAEHRPDRIVNVACLPIPELDREAAFCLLEHYAYELNIMHRGKLIEILDAITRDCGGNPYQLRAALLSWQ